MALFADTVALVYQENKSWVTDELPVSGLNGWPGAIRTLIDKHQLKGAELRLVLGHGLYQSMLIDKPELPREEYPTALPFLVKELVNESPMELVADGFVAPLKERLQAFSTQKKQIEQLDKACREAGCELLSVSAEEVVWGQLTAFERSQLVLHRRGKANLQLSAFKQQVLCFQRQLRGFSVPLLASDDAQSLEKGLQLDGLALELQRSLDFLSAQLRDAPITQLLISCDDDDDSELAQALSQRLNVKVEPVTPSHPSLASNAVRVAYCAVIEPEQVGINFYSDALKPKLELLTLPNVVMSWVAITVVLAALAGWFSWQSYQQQQELAAEQQRLQQKSAELERTKAALAKHLPSQIKVDVANGLEQHLAEKRAALEAIALHDSSLQVGYAGMMQQLSAAASGDISVQHLRVKGPQLNLEGLARTPDAVPAWLQEFRQYPSLSDRRFKLMTLGRNKQNIVTFKLLAERNQPAAPAVTQGVAQ
ncbi:MSHA biogenesis protein MshI [Photobacterium gaetbulicola Gung47]|uniref:MSHA biogenesis protein MshI n=1 Tax=Photobacterium gaetbulicola Gung47 TaxID=658445 RepID=A0A0C5WQL6_9GAMM|nr:PilN domain-containing protein [Photobacterium gaetbulicola]AJR07364.1 MSHA biogenesis protein MshI [Photobacterium gaetbulicola Gung47]